jgi:hypothetical protein
MKVSNFPGELTESNKEKDPKTFTSLLQKESDTGRIRINLIII